MQNKKQAFTLVELIVVITILAILGTIAFISLQGYSASSRDSVRISDVSNMKTSLELFHLDAGKYPLPNNAEEIKYGTDILWYQGNFGSSVVSQLSRNLNKIPIDPLSDKEYIFSTTSTRNEYEILNLLEGDLALNTIPKTNAANTTRTPRVDGQYNGVFIKTTNYIFPTPSLLTSEEIPTGAGLVIDATNIKSQITTGGKNIPNIGSVNNGTGKLDINLSVYTGTPITINSSDADKILVMKSIQGAYSGSKLASSDVYKIILNTADNDLAKLLNTIILDKTGSSSVVIIPDTEAPVGGNFIIDEGETINTTTINLTITCPEEEGVEMYISGDITETPSWETCTTTKSVILTVGDGTKIINMKFRDSLGNETIDEIIKSIILNTNAFSLNWLTIDDANTLNAAFGGNSGRSLCYNSEIHTQNSSTARNNCSGLGSSTVIIFKTDTLTAGKAQPGTYNASALSGTCYNIWLGQGSTYNYLHTATSCTIANNTGATYWHRSDYNANQFRCNNGNIGSVTCNVQQYANGNARWNSRTLRSGTMPINNSTLRYYAVWYK